MADQPASTLTPPFVYCLSLAPTDGLPDPQALNARERARLETIRSPQRARQYLASRLLVRQALSHASAQLGLPRPDFSQLHASGAPLRDNDLQLGLSHSAGHMVCAVHRGRVGVDIEHSRRRPQWQSLARRWFSEAEQQWLAEHESGTEAFLALWTLKEAWIKAHHLGIAGNLQSLRLTSRAPQLPELTADTQGRAWYAAIAHQDALRVALVWENADAPQVLRCNRLAGDGATTFTPRPLAWDPVFTINDGERES